MVQICFCLEHCQIILKCHWLIFFYFLTCINTSNKEVLWNFFAIWIEHNFLNFKNKICCHLGSPLDSVFSRSCDIDKRTRDFNFFHLSCSIAHFLCQTRSLQLMKLQIKHEDQKQDTNTHYFPFTSLATLKRWFLNLRHMTLSWPSWSGAWLDQKKYHFLQIETFFFAEVLWVLCRVRWENLTN